MAKLFNRYVVFCFVGLSSTLIDIALLYIFVEHLHMPVLPSAAISLVCASINGFLLNRKFTFKNESRNVYQQYLYFLTVSIIGLLLTLVFLSVFIETFGLRYMIAKLITVVLVTLWSFTANNFFVFKDTTRR